MAGDVDTLIGNTKESLLSTAKKCYGGRGRRNNFSSVHVCHQRLPFHRGRCCTKLKGLDIAATCAASGLTTDVNVLHNNQTTTSEPTDVPVVGEEVQG